MLHLFRSQTSPLPKFTLHSKPTERLPLRKKQCAQMRPIQLDDADWIKEIYLGLSEESRKMRFNGSLKCISSSFWQQLAAQTAGDAVHNGFGLLIFEEDRSHLLGQRPIGLGHYIQSGRQRAEIGMSILDSHQSKGLGRSLFARLAAHAQAKQINIFEAYVHPQNVPMQRLILHSGLPHYARQEGSMLEFQILLR